MLFGLGTAVYFGCFDLSRVTSDSMKPTLRGQDWHHGNLVLSERVSWWLRRPRHWEILTFRSPDGTQIMKRIVGLPGEHVQMRRHGHIFIDGREIRPPASLAFLGYFPFGNLCQNNVVACGDGYYVLGDYSQDSQDSRFDGPVRPDQLAGRAWLIVAPTRGEGLSMHDPDRPQLAEIPAATGAAAAAQGNSASWGCSRSCSPGASTSPRSPSP